MWQTSLKHSLIQILNNTLFKKWSNRKISPNQNISVGKNCLFGQSLTAARVFQGNCNYHWAKTICPYLFTSAMKLQSSRWEWSPWTWTWMHSPIQVMPMITNSLANRTDWLRSCFNVWEVVSASGDSSGLWNFVYIIATLSWTETLEVKTFLVGQPP